MTTTLQLLAAAELGQLAASTSCRSRLEAGMVLVARGYIDQPLSAARWAHLAFRLADLAARCPDRAITRVAQALADAGGLAMDVEQVLAHVGATESAAESLANEHEVQLLDHLRTLVDLCKPLRNVRLVSVHARGQCCGDDHISYLVHEHGAGARAPEHGTSWVQEPLESSWCYLIDGTAVEAFLAPVAFGGSCPQCGNAEVFLCDRIVVGPPRSLVRGRALGCGHESGAHLPTRQSRALARAVSLWAP